MNPLHETPDPPAKKLPPADPETQLCQCPLEGFCNRYARQMVGKRHEICSEKFVVFRPQSPEVCKAYRSKWDKDAAPVLKLLADDSTKVYLSDLKAIGGQEECTSREVARLGITGDPGITLTKLMQTHPEVATRAAKWIVAGKPKPSEAETTAINRRTELEKEVDAWIAAGRPLCTPEELATRLLSCEGDGKTPACPAFKDGRCMKCGGCGMKKAPLLARAYTVVTLRGDIPGKAEMRTARCPLNRWPILPMV